MMLLQAMLWIFNAIFLVTFVSLLHWAKRVLSIRWELRELVEGHEDAKQRIHDSFMESVKAIEKQTTKALTREVRKCYKLDCECDFMASKLPSLLSELNTLHLKTGELSPWPKENQRQSDVNTVTATPFLSDDFTDNAKINDDLKLNDFEIIERDCKETLVQFIDGEAANRLICGVKDILENMSWEHIASLKNELELINEEMTFTCDQIDHTSQQLMDQIEEYGVLSDLLSKSEEERDIVLRNLQNEHDRIERQVEATNVELARIQTPIVGADPETALKNAQLESLRAITSKVESACLKLRRELTKIKCHNEALRDKNELEMASLERKCFLFNDQEKRMERAVRQLKELKCHANTTAMENEWLRRRNDEERIRLGIKQSPDDPNK